MILKIRTHGDNNDKGIAWRIIDNISRIEYKLNVQETEEMKTYKENGITYIRTYPNRSLTEICILYKNGEAETMYTDDVVYILNDNGKTCDTINVIS